MMIFTLLSKKLPELRWSIVVLLLLISLCGISMLYSVAGGSIYPWALKQGIRIIIGVVAMLILSVTPPRFFYNQAYVLFLGSFLLLLGVEVMGFIGMGAKRWINLYIFNLQPSELMKLTLVLALARYFHHLPEDGQKWRFQIYPALFIFVPMGLILRQPDLGTAIVLLLTGSCLFFASGFPWWKIGILGVSVLGGLPVVWSHMHTYQKARVLTFLNPERDPLGAGYHIIQSKIAFGSGGFWGKGFLQGSQSQLNFLPEKQTDFIFTSFCEEMGFVGGVFVLSLYGAIILYAYRVGFSARNMFEKYMTLGMSAVMFLYVFINMAMIMGMLPVVGVPLPLMSYGGTSVLTFLMACGFVFSVDIHHNRRMRHI